ncbi:MAG: M1 family peptidase [Bacteroidetes bacterium]|nr:MAG: M1 family peptidase [Bacteroidota bacterium]
MTQKNLVLGILLICLTSFGLHAQPDRWQQRAEYKMDIQMDVKTHRFTGKQTLKYYNNSPDDLDRVFYHLYFNAFQPGSMMDVRSRTIPDPDPRVGDRISKLGPDEIGYQKIKSLTHNGKPVSYEVVGTILEVTLNEPIPAGGTAVFDMEFEAQVPVQIRRSGRDNREGIAYSMSQWYPKMCEYDYQGWHANPYIGREFYGIWGDFDVTISIDADYILGATGYLQNPEEIGYGYEPKGTAVKRSNTGILTWHFVAPNVHDFMWAADPDYEHLTYERPDGLVLHFFFQPGEQTTENWHMLPKIMDRAFDFINKTYGQYPYKKYSFIQGGDGGMEYPMGTLITGNRPLRSLVGVSVHELMHSWYQMALGTNESLYPWMDEGFTSYASSEVMNYLKKEKLIPGEPSEFPHAGANGGWVRFAESGIAEPMSIHSDHYQTNRAYGVNAYVKGEAFLTNLSYVIGKEAFDTGMLRYYDTWKFKHPNPNDFIRIMEKTSGLELDWFKEYMVNTTHTINYGIKSVNREGKKQTKITLERIGKFPMPIDLVVTYKKGKTETFHIPLRIMRGAKAPENDQPRTVAEDWPWTHPTYELILDKKLKHVERIEIDPSQRMADSDRNDNIWNKDE